MRSVQEVSMLTQVSGCSTRVRLHGRSIHARHS